MGEAQDTIEGYVQHIVYRNEENGYTVLVLEAGDDEVTCVGAFPAVDEGEYVEATGEQTFHPTYGPQFKVHQAHISIPKDGAAFERYLGSGAVKGIGAALAKRIIKHFGEDTMRIMQEEPERLAEVKGISARKAREIGTQIEERSQMQNALIYLAQYGISLTMGIRIYNQYQDRLYQVLRQNPYRLAEDIRGVGFKAADEIAGRIGIARDSEFRMRSGLFYALGQAAAQGHLYLPKEELFRRAADLLGVAPDDMDKYLMDLVIDKKIVVRRAPAKGLEEQICCLQGEAGQSAGSGQPGAAGRKAGSGQPGAMGQNAGSAQPGAAGQSAGSAQPDLCAERVYTAAAYHTELNAARMLTELNVDTGEAADDVDRRIAQIEKEDGIALDELQRSAVRRAAKSGLLILTGGPGTGKTTTINTMIRYFSAAHQSIALAAPTGRAAKRMTEATGCEASTIHRLLEISGQMDEEVQELHFERNADHPLEQDVIIIDEMSMVDIYLLHALLLAVVPGTRLILVGDKSQLPSVGPGCVLRDLIRAAVFPVVTLTKIFRQAQESDIVVNAHRINQGLPVRLDNHSRDFFFLRRADALVVQRVVLALVQEKMPRRFHVTPAEVQVLTPTRKGPLGVENLNRLLQKYLNPPAPDKRERETAQGLFREGDRVMQIRNDYQLEWEIRGKNGIVGQKGLGVFNGDMGIVRHIDASGELVTVAFEEGRTVEYGFKQLDELELAYAVTVHKAQGSEYPVVVIPLLGVPYMLQNRNLLYTAVTRAKKCVVLTGSEDIFRAMVDNATEEARYTGLAEALRELAAAPDKI